MTNYQQGYILLYENCNNGLDKITLTGEVQDIFKD